MNTTICGVDDRILYVITVWAIISVASRIYIAWYAGSELLEAPQQCGALAQANATLSRQCSDLAAKLQAELTRKESHGQ